MPDITNRIGVDSLDQDILLRSTQERQSKIFEELQPILTNPNSVFDPAKAIQDLNANGYNPNLDTPVGGNTIADTELDEKFKEAKAIQDTHRALSKQDPIYYKGIDTEQYLPYKPISKYLDEEYGFKMSPGISLGEAISQNEDAYSDIKNTVVKGIGKFLGRTAMGVVAIVGQGISYLGGLATGWANPGTWYDMLVNDEDYLTAAGDNVFSSFFKYLDEDVKNDWMPVYQEMSSQGKGFWYRLSHDSSFWTNEVSDGAAFALSAFVPALAISKIGLGARAISALSKLGLESEALGLGAENAVLGTTSKITEAQRNLDAFSKASKYLQNASKVAQFVDKSAVTVANTVSEAYFESRQTYEEVYNKLIESGVPDIIAKQKAADSAKGTFWANSAALLLSNAFETKLQFQALGLNRVDNALAKGINQAEKFGAYSAKEATTKFGRFMESQVGFYAKKLPEAILKEGYWEENVQNAIQRYYQNNLDDRGNVFEQLAAIGKQTLKQTKDATLGDDPETSISIGLGGLMGAGQSMISSAISKEYANQKKFRDDTISNLNQLQSNWLRYGDPYERDTNGHIVLEEVKDKDGVVSKQPKVSLPKVAAYMVKMNELSEKMEAADNVKHDLIQPILKQALFAEYALANISAGLGDTLKQNLRNSVNYSDEDLNKIGLEKTENFQDDINKKIAFIDKLEKLDKSISNDVLFKQVKDKKDVQIEQLRRSELLRNGSMQLVIEDMINDHTSKLQDLDSKLDLKYNKSGNDSVISKLNSLQSQIRYNQQYVNNPDYDSASITVATELLNKLKDEKQELLEANRESLKDIKKDEDGTYKYENTDREKDPDFIASEKYRNRIAQLTNSKALLSEEFYKYADLKNGFENYKTSKEEKAKASEEKLTENLAKQAAKTEEQKLQEAKPTVSKDKKADIERRRQEALFGNITPLEFETTDTKGRTRKTIVKTKVDENGFQYSFETTIDGKSSSTAHPKVTKQEFINSSIYKNLDQNSKEFIDELPEDAVILLQSIAISTDKNSAAGLGNGNITIGYVSKELNGRVDDIVLKYQPNEINAKYDAEIAALPKQEARETNPFYGYKELEKGDYDKLSKLATKLVFTTEDLTEDENKLKTSYPELLKNLTETYADKVKDIRQTQIKGKIEVYEKLRDTLFGNIIEANQKIGNLDKQAEDIVNSYKNGNSQLSLKQLTKVVNSINDNINTMRDWLDKNEPKLVEYDQEIERLYLELESKASESIQPITDIREHIEKEKAWITREIDNIKNKISVLEKLVKELVKIAKSLFPSYEPVTGKPRSTYEDNLKKGRFEAVQYNTEIMSEKEKLAALKDTLAELEKENKEIDEKYDKINKEIQEFKDNYKVFTNWILSRARALQAQDLKKKPEYTEEEKNLIKIFSQGNSETSNIVVPFEQKIYDGEGYLRELNSLFYTTTDPNYSDGNERVKNHHEFLNTLATISDKDLKDKIGDDKIETIYITGHNANAMGFKDLIDSKYLDTSDVVNTGIYLAYVLNTKQGYFFIDKDLNKIGKVGEVTDENRPKILFSSLRKGDFRDQAERERYESNYGGPEAVQKVKDQALVFRNKILEETKSTSPAKLVGHKFAITRGLANKVQSFDGQLVKNSVTETLIDEKDLLNAVVEVPTIKGDKKFEDRIINGVMQKLPIGRPLLITRNKLNTQFHYLDNNELTEEQKQSVKLVIYNLAKDSATKLENELNKLNNGAPIEKNSPLYFAKLAEFLKNQSVSKVSLLNQDYIKFLKNVVFWRVLDTNSPLEAAYPNQIWIRGSKIMLGNSGDYLDIDNPEYILQSKELDSFLNKYHHNFNIQSKDDAKKEFVEYYNKDGKLETRKWKSYNHYMMSDKNPDGSKRVDIPLTTKIKTRDQALAEKGSNTYFPYIQRSTTLINELQEQVEKSKSFLKVGSSNIETGTASLDEFTVGAKPTPKPASNPAPAATNQTGNKIGNITITTGDLDEFRATPTATNQAKKNTVSSMSLAERFMQDSGSTVNPVTGKAANIVKEDPSENINPDDAADLMNFRLVGNGVYRRESNLKAVIEEVSKMLPQFPIQELDQVIRAIGGRTAWGQFTGNAILIYTDAEEGTLYHEAFEALVNSILTNSQWNNLYSEFKSRKGTFTDRETGATIKYSEATAHQSKEELAEEFRDFKLSGKRWSGEKEKMNLFERLLHFIKSLINNLSSIEKTFEKLDAGKYSKSAVSLNTRFTNSYRIADVPQEYYHKFIQGATAVMFRDVFLSERSFTDFDENNINEKDLYNRLKTSMIDRYEQYMKNALNLPEGNAMRTAIINAYDIYTKIVSDEVNPSNNKTRWESFIEDHKNFLKPYKINFTEAFDDNSTEEERENKNRNDYASHMEIDAKKTASTSIRLLLGTMINSKVKSRNVNGIRTYSADENGMPELEPEVSVVNQMFLPELINYDNVVKDIFNNLTGLNTLSSIQAKLKEISGLTNLENTNDVQDVLSQISNDQANLISLYNRVFGTVATHEDDTSWKMKVKFNNFMAKQNPNPELMVVTNNGDTYFIESNSKENYEILRKQVNAHIKNFTGTVFARNVNKSSGQVWYTKADGINIPDLTKTDNFVKIMTSLFNLGNEFNAQFMNSLSDSEREYLSNALLKIMNVLKYKNSNKEIVSLSLDGMGIEGRIKSLLNFYVSKTSKGINTQFLNVDNKPQSNFVLNNYMSRVLSDLSVVKTRDEFYELNPQYKTIYPKDSIVLNRFFDEDGNKTNYNLKLGYVEGLTNSLSREGQKNSSLSKIDRMILSLNANLNGIYYTLLPADSETEWSLKLGEFIPFKTNFESSARKEILDTFTKYLTTEIELAINTDSSLIQLNKTHSDGIAIGKSLRIFRKIIGTDSKLLANINEDIKNKIAPEKIVSKYQKRIGDVIIAHINDMSRKKFASFLNEGIIEKELKDYRFNLLDESFAKSMGKEKSLDGGYILTEDQVMDVLNYHTVNYFVANTEMFKLFFGDPAEYKDLTKRIKSFTSGVEWSYWEKEEEDNTKGLNGYLNQSKNSAIVKDKDGNKKEAALNKDDIFNYEFSNSLNMLVVSDHEVADSELYNQLKDILKNADVFLKINEADAQSIVDIQTFREVFIKSGWRWTDAHEEQYQYEMAYARNRMSKKGSYNYNGNTELEALDNEILDKYPTPPSLALFTPFKPLYAGVDPRDSNYKISLIKTSVFPITYRLAESREMESLYNKMLKGVSGQRINWFTFESSHKIGLEQDSQGKVTSLYGDNLGQMNDFTAKKTPIEHLSFKHLGIQVETQGNSHGNTLGTQLTKDIKLNLFSNGVPIDFLEKFDNHAKAIVDFYKMSESDREKNSEFYKLYKQHEQALVDLKQINYNDLLLRLGAKEVTDANGNSEYNFKDLTKVRKMILDEMLRRELDENTVDSVELSDDLQTFKRSVESLPSYDIIRNILYALVDKAILSPKVNGHPYIQVASTFFNNETRQATYFDKETNEWVKITNNAEYQKALKAKRKITYTSSELGFYKMTKDGKEVEAMEILLPHIYKEDINNTRIKRGLTPLSDEQIIKYLEETQPELLEGVGFRIPTQALSSIDFFKIKGFLPETFGNAVVVPSAITAKSGSDFDVDKLNTYLNNWRLNKQGLPEIVGYKDDSNSSLEERYNSFIYEKFEEVLYPIKKIINKLNSDLYKNNKAISKLQRDLDLFEELTSNPKEIAEGKLMLSIFGVDIKDMQEAIAADENLNKLQFEGQNIYDVLEDSRKQYDDVLKDIKSEVTIEEFAKLPIGLQNNKQAIENRYIKSIRNILSLPYNFQFLMSPNSDENIEKNRNAVRNAENPNFKKDADLDYTQFTDFEYMTTQRHYFVKGKKDIGIFAVAMTNYANSQITGLVIAPIEDIRYEDRFILTELNNNNFSLPFNYNTLNLNGIEYISLSGRFDTDMVSIMDKVSGYINGAVDIAKDPKIMDMGMLSELAGVYIMLERIGVPGETIALFMKQPIIRDFMKEVLLKKSMLANRSKFNNQKEIIEDLLNRKYSDGNPYSYQNIKLTNEVLTKMLRKASNTPENGARDLTKDELNYQRLILANFLKARIFSNDLLETVQSSNHDTTNIRSYHVIERKNFMAAEAKKGNVIKSLSDALKVKDGATSIKEKTFVGNDVKILNNLSKLFGPQIFTLQKENPSELIRSLAQKVFKATQFKGSDAYEKAMRDIEIKVIDYMVNNSNVQRGNSPIDIKTISGHLFITSLIEDGRKKNNPNSIKSSYEQVMSAVKNTKNHPLANNIFLNNMQFLDDANANISTFTLKNKVASNDVYTKNRMTEALRQLRDNETSARLYNSILYGSLIQNGIKFKRDSINGLIPNEDYGKQITFALQNIDNQDFSAFNEIMVRIDPDNNELVEKINPDQIFYFDAEAAKDEFLGGDAIRKTSYIKNRNILQKDYFGGNTPEMIFLYAGREELNDRRLSDYVLIDTIHPDYLVTDDSMSEFMSSAPRASVSSEVIEMIKRKDFSFVQKILFKKVGLTNGKVLYIEKQTKTKDKHTNLYAMYKPINYWGNKNFNEFKNVKDAQGGDKVGDVSILRNQFRTDEKSDIDLLTIIDEAGYTDNIHMVDDPTNFKNDNVISIENQNISVSLGELPYSQEELDNILNNMEDQSEGCKS